jgi:hypothetical protein
MAERSEPITMGHVEEMGFATARPACEPRPGTVLTKIRPDDSGLRCVTPSAPPRQMALAWSRSGRSLDELSEEIV